MGIPYFFAYIIKNHKNIINKFMDSKKIEGDIYDNFFLDSNSIIYDIVHNIKNYDDICDIEKHIIMLVISKIENYIHLVNPKNIIYIAFDGTPPLSKLEQQRTRRYKSWYSNKIKKNITKETEQTKKNNVFDTIHITSGTLFMDKLSFCLKNHFGKNSKIIFSGSDENGEGESKIFNHIRNNPELHINKNNVIFGLDSDIIILSLNHIKLNNKLINILLLRENSHFSGTTHNKNIKEKQECQNNENNEELWLLNINNLGNKIIYELTNDSTITCEKEQYTNIIKDYIFLSFFLGNDFIPGHISLNLRTGGFDKILNGYKETLLFRKKYIIENGDSIIWKNLYDLISFLEKLEIKHITDEMFLRNKKEKYVYDMSSCEKIYEKFEAIPNYERSIEKYINPCHEEWQYRYYKSLFNVDIDNKRRKQICINYLEALEWIFRYYTHECPDYRWKYNYEYSPLLEDLVKYIPVFNTQFIKNNNNLSITPLTQLLYVLPLQNIKEMYPDIYVKLIEKYSDFYTDEAEIVWAFKKYFWESSPKLPEIDINLLEDFVKSI